MTTSNETYEKGLQIRREVIGADYADEQSADDFSREYQKGLIPSCLSMKLSKAAETQRMSHRGFQSLCHIRVRTVQLPPTSL